MHRLTAFGLAFALLVGGCGGEEPPPAPPPPTVETFTVREATVPNIIELPGRVEAVRVAEVRARVNGIVQRRLYEEGTDVRAGQALFRIDPSELRASYAEVKASLQRARATAANAQAVVNRYRPLVAQQAISQQEYDAANAAAREAQASVAQFKAQLDAASLQLGYTTVRAPIAGRASRAEVTEGALVSGAEATLMTRIEQLSPVYVTFAQSSSKVMDVRRKISSGEIELDESGRTEVQLTFEDGTEYPIPGYIDFLDFSVNETTGTVNLRAEFANPDRVLLPGEFVRARVFAGQIKGGIAVPQKAVQVSEKSASVFLVGRDGKAVPRPVTLGQLAGGMWIIQDGLKPGDRVIVSNLQKIRPGMAVKLKQQQGKSADTQSRAKQPAPKAKGNQAVPDRGKGQ